MILEVESGALDQSDNHNDVAVILHLLESGDILNIVPHHLTALSPCKGIFCLYPVPHMD